MFLYICQLLQHQKWPALIGPIIWTYCMLYDVCEFAVLSGAVPTPAIPDFLRRSMKIKRNIVSRHGLKSGLFHLAAAGLAQGPWRVWHEGLGTKQTEVASERNKSCKHGIKDAVEFIACGSKCGRSPASCLRHWLLFAEGAVCLSVVLFNLIFLKKECPAECCSWEDPGCIHILIPCAPIDKHILIILQVPLFQPPVWALTDSEGPHEQWINFYIIYHLN